MFVPSLSWQNDPFIPKEKEKGEKPVSSPASHRQTVPLPAPLPAPSSLHRSAQETKRIQPAAPLCSTQRALAAPPRRRLALHPAARRLVRQGGLSGRAFALLRSARGVSPGCPSIGLRSRRPAAPRRYPPPRDNSNSGSDGYMVSTI